MVRNLSHRRIRRDRRKSVQPMATGDAESAATSCAIRCERYADTWSLEAALLAKADPMVSGDDPFFQTDQPGTAPCRRSLSRTSMASIRSSLRSRCAS
jgi:hypothetical protein